MPRLTALIVHNFGRKFFVKLCDTSEASGQQPDIAAVLAHGGNKDGY